MSDNFEMKPGLSYVSTRTDQYRYADSEGKVQWVQPLSRYKAFGKILRGQAVSIATAEDIKTYAEAFALSQEEKDKLLSDPDPYIIPTDTKVHEKSIGLALEPAENYGDIVHVQSFGKFVFDTAYEGKDPTFYENKDYNFDHNGKEYNPKFTYEDVGRKVYVANDTSGYLTVDETSVYKNYQNIICLGYLTDAPVEGSDGKTVIEIRISGDQRGLLDATQFEVTLGEDIVIPEDDPVVLLAIGKEDDSQFKARLCFTPQDKNDYIPQDFIAFQRMDGNTSIISLASGDLDINTITDNEDAAFISMAKSYASLHGASINVAHVALSDDQLTAKV